MQTAGGDERLICIFGLRGTEFSVEMPWKHLNAMRPIREIDGGYGAGPQAQFTDIGSQSFVRVSAT